MPFPIAAAGATALPALGKGAAMKAAAIPLLKGAAGSLFGSGLSSMFGGGQGQMPALAASLPIGQMPGAGGPDRTAGDLLPIEPISLMGNVRQPPPITGGFPEPGLMSPTLAADPLMNQDPLLALSRRGPRGQTSAQALLRMLLR